MFKLRKKGFTLIELLVVIAIIGLLATIVSVSISSARAKARDGRRQADLRTIQLALEAYYNDNGFYPRNIYARSDVSATPSSNNGLAGGYLPVVPSDPNASTACTISGVGTACYYYYAIGAAGGGVLNCNYSNRYHVAAKMELTGSSGLVQDSDKVPDSVNAPICTGSGVNTSPATTPFNGTSVACTATAGTAQPNGTELCLDYASY